MKLEVGDAARGAAHVFGVHAQHDDHERARLRKRAQNIGAIFGEIRMIHRHDAGVLGARFERQRADRFEGQRLERTRGLARPHRNHRGMVLDSALFLG